MLDKGGEVRVAGNLGEVGFAAEMGWVVREGSFLTIVWRNCSDWLFY